MMKMSRKSGAGFLFDTESKFGREERNIIEKAYQLCLEVHNGQKRRSGEDFSIHPIAVAHTLLKWGGDVNMVTAALLHDTVEDSTLSIDDIRKEFGSQVSLYVFALTNDSFEGESFEKAISFYQEDLNILVIKIADRLHNMQTLDFMSHEKRIEKSRETLLLYVPIARFLKLFQAAEQLKSLSESYLNTPH